MLIRVQENSRSPTVPSRATPSLLVHPCPTRSVNAPLSSHPLFCPFCTHRTRHRASYYFKHHTLTVCATGSRSSSTDLSVSDSLDILNLDSAAATDAAELRKAYYGRMREIHPDVNPELDTTQSAALVNAAYAALLKEVDESASGVVVTGDAFDTCDGPVNSFFVSPFVCGTDPFLWRELHEAVCAALQLLTNMSTDQAEKDVGSMYEEVTEVETEEALQAVGLRAAPGALVWLTASQKAAVDELMVELEETLAFDVGEWFLVDSLLRAERANRKGWQS